MWGTKSRSVRGCCEWSGGDDDADQPPVLMVEQED
jgi:hypothetical protein